MVSSVVVHGVGTTVLLAVLVFTILHVTTTLQLMKNENIKNNFNRIADSIAVQLLYAISLSENVTLRLNYPVIVANDLPYNIIIGTGVAINNKFKFLPSLDPNYIYVVIATTDKTIHVEKKITKTIVMNKTIIIINDPKLFGSSTLTYINITVYNNEIYLDLLVKGALYK